MDKIGLVIDCCNKWILVGLFGNGISFQKVELAPRKSFVYLHDWILELLNKAKIKKPDWIACTRGPGSFTGVRICVSTSRNLAQLWKVPVLGVDSLAFVARQILEINKKNIPSSTIAILLDGRQKKVYANKYSTTDFYADISLFSNIQDLTVREFIKTCPGNTLFYTDDIESIQSYLDDKSLLHDLNLKIWPDPSINILYDHIQKLGGYNATSNWQDLLPLYIRPDPAHAKHPDGFNR